MVQDTPTDGESEQAACIVDDVYRQGVYYDSERGTFHQIDVDEETGEAILCDIDGEMLEQLDVQQWVDVRRNLMPVPQDAVDDPVGYFERKVNDLLCADTYGNRGLLYADEVTEVVEQ